ncbi:MAG: AcvB/VirJ family lysyl-phosphatidylglycerol hydrolase, partial [Stenotrophobium sp.]
MKYGWMVFLLLFSAGGQAASPLAHGRFKHVEIYSPKSAPSGFVLLLSGSQGWNATMAKMAQALSEKGALVAGIDTPQLFHDLDRDDGDCVFPDGDLDNLSRFVQAYEKVPGYLPPLLAGYGRGATFAYAVLAQAPDHTFAGALMLDFSPQLSLRKLLCVDKGVKFRKLKHRRGVELLPVQRIKAPLMALQRENSAALATVQSFFAQVPGAAVVALPAVKREPGADGDWQPQWQAAYLKLTAAEIKPVPPPASLGDLPVIELPAAAVPSNANADTLAVILSGDGGWADLDKSVGKALSQKGVAVVGVDSLRYFW